LTQENDANDLASTKLYVFIIRATLTQENYANVLASKKLYELYGVRILSHSGL